MSLTVSRQIVHADRADTNHLRTLIAAAVSALPVATWLVSDPDERGQVLMNLASLYLDTAFTHGVVHTTADRTGAALWLANHPGRNPDPAYDHKLAAAAGPRYVQRFRDYDRLVGVRRPTGQRYERLAILAVDPNLQKKGAGTALLADRLASFDRTSTPAYAEADGTSSRDLCARHGFIGHGAPIDLPGGPRIYPMWRPAHAYGSAAKSIDA